jgi:hypothetical protein
LHLPNTWLWQDFRDVFGSCRYCSRTRFRQREVRSGCDLVVVGESAEDGLSANPVVREFDGRWRWRSGFGLGRGQLAEPAVWPGLVPVILKTSRRFGSTVVSRGPISDAGGTASDVRTESSLAIGPALSMVSELVLECDSGYQCGVGGNQHVQQLPPIPLTETTAELTEALQRSLLPQVSTPLDGAQIAFRYLPGNDALAVGGDWFDAMVLPGARLGLVIGDVMGHGVASVAMMGQLRTAVQTLAYLGLPPDQLLRQLDELAQRLSDTHLATCLFGVYDRVTRRLVLASAGHPPPIIARGDGTTELVELPPGPPIGVGGHGFDSVDVDVVDGDTLVLYTDGLVEIPKRDIDDGLTLLCASVPGCDVPLDEACDVILNELAPDRSDDVALLIARFRGIDPEWVADWLLEPVPLAASQARRLVRATLTRWDLLHLADTAELLASELITNSIVRASRPIGLRLLYTGTLTCEVQDDDYTLPAPRAVAALEESGRGLSIVNAVARRWGASRTAAGKLVWFEL